MKSRLLSAVLLLLLSTGITAVVETFDRRFAERKLLQGIATQLELHHTRLEGQIAGLTGENRRFAATLAADPERTVDALVRDAQAALARQPRIASILISRPLQVDFVYPTRGNEAVIGMDYALHPEFMGSIKRAQASRGTVVDAPVRLLQTGRPGLVLRTPVFDPGTQAAGDGFRALVSMAVDLEGLLIGAGLLSPQHDFVLAIRSRSNGQPGHAVFGKQEVFGGPHVSAEVSLPDGHWELAAAPATAGPAAGSRTWWIRGAGAALGFLLLFAYLRRSGLIAARPTDGGTDAAAAHGRTVPLRGLLLGAVLVVTPLVVGVSGWFSFQASMHVAEELEQQQVDELARQLRERVTSFFEVPRRVAAFNAEQFRNGFLDPRDQESMLRNFLLQLRQQPLLTFLSMGTAEGEYFAASRPPLGEDRALRILQATRAEARVMNLYRVDDANRRSTLISVGNTYFDARTRPWFKAAAAAEGVLWYPAYRYVIHDSHGIYDAMGIGMAAPLYDAQRRFLGVVTADVALSQLSAFLRSQVAELGGVAFLAEADGALLASSETDPIYRLDGERTIRFKAAESDNPTTRGVAAVIRAAASPEGNRFATLGNGRHLVHWQTIRLPDGPALTIALALPESRFAGTAQEAFRGIGFLALLFVALGILCALLLAHGFAQPLHSLSRWARRLAAGEWHASPPVSSPIREISSLTDTLREMAGQLKRHTEELEQLVAERTAALEQANRQLATLSSTDGLTGIANRRHFDEALAAECARARRSAQPMALMMLDVDLFKDYNDHYGHQAGDEVLRRVAAVLAGNARRPGDLAARYGGEEFAIIAANTDRAGALAMAEAIRSAIELLEIPHARSPRGRLTASLGVALLAADDDITPAQLVARADEALYRAKAGGRNRVDGAAAQRSA